VSKLQVPMVGFQRCAVLYFQSGTPGFWEVGLESFRVKHGSFVHGIVLLLYVV